ncbi:uncharacterized protein LY79DRAFT_550339 [Colletotrichum navitas]|uniref:Uncharacterized protein n=1 Tax=Colletotrichum navitas TaxID=681940 RepID=A0AAD8Q241_9PEZI|nr:uncharacterized protein LY79DRAFT_550339 [Colletotrichum navitas]KAK1593936.1 hypothetical protein LY79DRAFT_550339 [Colletotrichum navitas]
MRVRRQGNGKTFLGEQQGLSRSRPVRFGWSLRLDVCATMPLPRPGRQETVQASTGAARRARPRTHGIVAGAHRKT